MIDRLITSKDHASVQINVVDVDADGKALPTSTPFALCGQVRAMGESDDSINRLATRAGCTFLLNNNVYTDYTPFSSATECMELPEVNPTIKADTFMHP